MSNPLDGFSVSATDFRFVGKDLQRPECILAERDGTLWSADARGGVVRISPDGAMEVITQAHSGAFETTSSDAERFVSGTLPNGLAFEANGDILISNFGTDCLERMRRDGHTEVLFDSLDGQPIGKVNFVARDSRDRIWITVSTMLPEWPRALCKEVVDGRVLLYEANKGVRIVADGLQALGDNFSALDEASREQALGKLEGGPFFSLVYTATINGLYLNEELWMLFGYEGSSLEHGGYLYRGFDEVDWLPQDDGSER